MFHVRGSVSSSYQFFEGPFETYLFANGLPDIPINEDTFLDYGYGDNVKTTNDTIGYIAGIILFLLGLCSYSILSAAALAVVGATWFSTQTKTPVMIALRDGKWFYGLADKRDFREIESIAFKAHKKYNLLYTGLINFPFKI